MRLFSAAHTKKLDLLFSRVKDRDEALSLEELHGFLFGLAVTPEPVPPSEWLPEVFGPEGPVFESDQDAQTCLGSLFEIYNLFMAESNHGRLRFPFDYEKLADGGLEQIEEWAYGLYLALTLRPELWGYSDEYADLPETDLPPAIRQVIDACDIITAVALPEERHTFIRTLPGREPKSEEEIAAILFSLVPECVRIVQAHGDELRRRMFPGRAPPARRAAGRNDPCPCGSGKKYKKCCGAA